jgi:hypothetical protein
MNTYTNHAANIDNLAATYRTDDMDASNEAILRSYAAMRRDLEEATRCQVIAARSMGMSWAKIGAAMGMSKQGAWDQWRKSGTGWTTSEDD